MISIDVQKVSKHVTIQTPNSANTLLILDDVSLKIDASETAVIMGASGSGKSTLLSLMAGLDVPSSGEVVFQEKKFSTLTEAARAEIRAKHIGFIFQQFYLIDNLTALENVWLPLEMLKKIRDESLNDSGDLRDKATEVLKQVGLSERLMHFPSELSGGEQQRVAIARAFALSPEILFADEPTGNLDTKTGKQIIDLLFELNDKYRSTLVFVTHDSNLSKRCQKQWQLEGGRLVT